MDVDPTNNAIDVDEENDQTECEDKVRGSEGVILSLLTMMLQFELHHPICICRLCLSGVVIVELNGKGLYMYLASCRCTGFHCPCRC